MKLTDKQARFVAQYVIDLNAKQAAIRAGYSAKTAMEQGYRLLRNAQVQAAIEAKNAKHLEKLDVTAERVLQERARIAFFDPRKLFDAQGKPLPIHELDDDTAAVVAGYEHDAGVTKVKLADKNASLTALEKHLGMYKDDSDRPQSLNIYLNLGDDSEAQPSPTRPPLLIGFNLEN
jgi:phage terminase small subunit